MKGRKARVILAAVVMAAALTPLAWADDPNVNPTGFPIVKQKITLKGFAAKHAWQLPWNDMIMLKEMEKKSNVVIDWENVPEEAYGEKRNLKIASGDLPDIFSRGGFSDTELNTYGDQGLFIDLKPYIGTYATNLQALAKKDPSKISGITTPEGRIYALAMYSELNTSNKMWIYKPWLDKLKMKVPATTDEFYKTMLAFKDKNPSGKDGAVPWSDFNSEPVRILTYFAGAFGLGNKGSDYFGYRIDRGPDGKARFIATDPMYKEELIYLNKLYAEKLLDQNFFTHKIEDWVALGKDRKLGAFILHNANDLGDTSSEFTVMLPPKGPKGERMQTFLGSSQWRGNTIITSANKHPEATVRWFDYWYSDQGYVDLQWGIKGQTYFINKDGKYSWSDEIYNSPNTQKRGEISPLFGGGFVTIEASDELEKRPWDPKFKFDQFVAATKEVRPYFPKYSVEPLQLTAKELEIVTDFRQNALQYVSECEAKFISGNMKFSEWDGYVKTVKGMGLDAYLKVYTDSFARSSVK